MIDALLLNEPRYYYINTVKDYSQSFKKYSQYLNIDEQTLDDFLYNVKHTMLGKGDNISKESYIDNYYERYDVRKVTIEEEEEEGQEGWNYIDIIFPRIFERIPNDYIDITKYKILILTYEIDYRRLNEVSYLIKKFIRKHFFVIYIPQDEYQYTNVKGQILKDWNVNLSFVNVNENDAPIIFNNNFTIFKTVLTGYASEIDNIKIPISDRKTDIFYRATPLPYIYGELGHEKVNIGKKMKAYAVISNFLRSNCPGLELRKGFVNNLNVDIEWEMDKKIFGEEWYSSLVNSKTTLATCSGCKVFDQEPRNEEIEKILAENPDYTYEDAKKDFDIEPMFEACEVSPKMFEAITLGTVLIMYEGKYKGIFKPNIHYIELKKDHSNINDVFKKINNDKYLQNMADRAYKDIIESGKYSYESFIKYFDSVVKKEYSRYLSKHKKQNTNLSIGEA